MLELRQLCLPTSLDMEYTSGRYPAAALRMQLNLLLPLVYHRPYSDLQAMEQLL